MTEKFEPGQFRVKRERDRREKEASGVSRLTRAAILLSLLIVLCIVLYKYLN